LFWAVAVTVAGYFFLCAWTIPGNSSIATLTNSATDRPNPALERLIPILLGLVSTYTKAPAREKRVRPQVLYTHSPVR
jgi:hypothetical protein